jgi:flagellar basal-body rod modification protein FlgD
MSAIGNDPTTTGAALNGSTSVTNPKATLDKNGFLKMFVAQMQNQDPSSSQDPNESTQMMAMFSMVEQVTNLAMQEQNANAVGLIGRTVSYTDAKGNLQSGVVNSVATSSLGATTLTVGDQAGIDPATINSVA